MSDSKPRESIPPKSLKIQGKCGIWQVRVIQIPRTPSPEASKPQENTGNLASLSDPKPRDSIPRLREKQESGTSPAMASSKRRTTQNEGTSREREQGTEKAREGEMMRKRERESRVPSISLKSVILAFRSVKFVSQSVSLPRKFSEN